MRRTFIGVGVCVLAVTAATAAERASQQQRPANQTPPGPASGGLLGRPSPPQPTQKQGIEYFIGTWTFTWTGRESQITAGPRTGSTSYARQGDAAVLEFVTEGKSDATGPYKETGTLEWSADKKAMVMRERLPGDVEVSSNGDWSSPIAIRFESAPIRVQAQTLRLRRTFNIISATSFSVAEEISIDGAPFQRLGGGVFMKRVSG